MINYLKPLLLLSFLMSQIHGKFERHNQSCGGLNGLDVKWWLDIQKDNSYSFRITTKKNEYGSLPKNSVFVGVTENFGDTLKLYKDDIKDSSIAFFIKNDKLVYLADKSNFGGKQLEFLDYLMKIDNQSK